MRRIALQGVLSASVAGAVAILVFVLAVEAHKPALRFAQQVAAGAQKLFEAGQREVAISALDEVLQRTPDSLIARRELAMELVASGQWAEAATQLRLVLSASPPDASAARKLAESLEKLGDLRGAITYSRLACKLDPENGIYWIALAGALLRSGDHEEALRAGQRAVRYAAGVPEAHVQLGFAKWQTGDMAGARSAFSEALALDPGNRPALDALEKLGAGPASPPRRPSSAPLESARLISNPIASVE
jgi:tetratricopeptide (TPR) repeat protein